MGPEAYAAFAFDDACSAARKSSCRRCRILAERLLSTHCIHLAIQIRRIDHRRLRVSARK
jgi:hypothetical protein